MPELRLLTPKRHRDERGWFSETFKASEFAGDARATTVFVQDNHAMSLKAGTLRGLHFQVPPHAQAKLVRCLRGSFCDVAVDLRSGSPTYGRWVAAELSAANGRALFVPAGFAHGYLTLEPETEIFYKVSDYYAPDYERGLRFDDPQIGIDWPVQSERMVLSPKDRSLPYLRDFASPFAFDGTPLRPLEA
jgi:dTDP-4-dehydrorhamnose 3,5-epimerase